MKANKIWAAMGALMLLPFFTSCEDVLDKKPLDWLQRTPFGKMPPWLKRISMGYIPT